MPMNFNDFGIDSASMAGSLENRLSAARQAGFKHAMISASDIVGHPSDVEAAVQAIRDSGLRVTGMEALRDFEGLTGKMHDYKVDVAKSMLELCSRIGGRLLLIEASSSVHADIDPEKIARQAIREIGYCNGQDDDVFHADTVCSIRADRAEFPGRFSDTRKFSSACFSACPSFDVSCSPMSFRAAEFRQLTALSCMFHDHSAQTL